MADGFVIALAALHFERGHLLAALVLQHVGNHAGAGDGRGAYADLALVVHEQHTIKRHGFSRLDVEAFENSVKQMDQMSDKLRSFIEARAKKSFSDLDEEMKDY